MSDQENTGFDELAEPVGSGVDFASELIDTPLEDEMRNSYLDYAMSVIVGRALPDARDGLKPVHRRVLFSMKELGVDWNKPYKKSARVVGDVIGKYHPHGDSAVYETMVRMAQDFSLRYPMVDGQGNFGSIDGDNAAAMRYTEARLSRLAHEMLADLDKETVDMGPNYDGSEQEPLTLPTRFPSLLVNGSAGIAVGMATNIAPHNMSETLAGALALLDNPALTFEELVKIIPAPDFPTGGIIWGVGGALEAARTGRGSVVIRARVRVEEVDGRDALVVDEIPYQVNKRTLQERIAELARDKDESRRIDGIHDVRDESDKSGMRLVVELRRGVNPDVVLNQLYKQTDLQKAFSVNMIALVDGKPELITLKQSLEIFLRHRREVVYRRCLYELRRARERGHSLEGYAVALANLDEVVELIKTSPTPDEARSRLAARRWKSALVEQMLKNSPAGARAAMPEGASEAVGLFDDGYALSDKQIADILALNLRRLTGMEQDKIIGEYKETVASIEDLTNILATPSRITQIIRDELRETQQLFGDPRRSEIVYAANAIEDEDLIPRQQMVATLSVSGYIKAQPLADFTAQKRGGRGSRAADLKDEDALAQIFSAQSHDQMLCFSSRGRVYAVKVYALPSGSRASRGRPINNLFPLQPGETITSLTPIAGFAEDLSVFMISRAGISKRVTLSQFKNLRQPGLNAIDLDEGDELAAAIVTDGKSEILLFTSEGKAVRLEEAAIRQLSRTARGTRALTMPEGVKVLGALANDEPNLSVLTVSQKGFGKRTPIETFRKTGRLAKGVRSMSLSEETGPLVAVARMREGEEALAITTAGVMIRVRGEEIREASRSARGVRVLRLDKGQTVAAIATISLEALDEEAKAAELRSQQEGAESAEEAAAEAEGGSTAGETAAEGAADAQGAEPAAQ
jgi:DNA gyrase subunit A